MKTTVKTKTEDGRLTVAFESEAATEADWYQLKALAEDGEAAGPWHGAWVYIKRSDGQTIGYLAEAGGWNEYVRPKPDGNFEVMGRSYSHKEARQEIEEWWQQYGKTNQCCQCQC